MASKRGFNRKFYLSYIHQQDTWGTLEAEANLFPFRINSEPLVVTPELVNDTDEVGGAEEATEQEILSYDVAGPLTQNKAKAPLLAALLAYCAGQSTDTTVDTSAGRHVITPLDGTFEMPTFSGLDLLTASAYVAYHNLAVESLELSTQRKGFLQIQAQLIGSGNFATSGVTVGSLGVAPAMGPSLKCGDLKVFRSVDAGATLPATFNQGAEDLPGSAADVSATFQNFRFQHNNRLLRDDAYEPGSGLYRARAERERRQLTLGFDVELEDTTYLGYLTAQNVLALEFDFVTGTLAGAATIYYGAQLLFPMVKLTRVTPQGGTGKLRYACEAIILDDGTNAPYQATVWDKNTTGLLQS